MSDSEQAGFPITTPARIYGNGFQSEIERGEMHARRDVGLAQDRGAGRAKPRAAGRRAC